jgi:hypothetical protein
MGKDMKQNKNWTVAILGIIIIILFYLLFIQRATIIEANNLTEALSSEVQNWKDKDSLNHGKSTIIETNNPKDFINAHTTDSLIMKLQDEVSDMKKYIKNSGSVTYITNVTEVAGGTTTEVSYDSLKRPIYRSDFNLDNWVSGNIVAGFDTTLFKLKYKSELAITLGQERDGLFKKKPFAEVIDKNPYAGEPQIRTYQVTPMKPKLWSIGVFGGYGIGLDFKPQPIIGVGVGFTPLRF